MRNLPDFLQIWPGHGAGSACGRALGAVPQSTLGYEKQTNWAFAVADEEQFVQAVLARQPEPPTYFAEMKHVNKKGPDLVRTLALPRLEKSSEQIVEDIQAGIPVIDTRSSGQYLAEHIPRTLNIPFGSIFLNWAGWLIPYDRPFSLIVDEALAPDVHQQLRLIGLEHVAHVWSLQALADWKNRTLPLQTISQVSASEVRHLLAEQRVTVLDVRSEEEYQAGHIPGSQHIHLGYLAKRVQELPLEKPIVVQCQSGMRSPIGTSLLEALKYPHVMDLEGGFLQWQTAGYPTATGA